MKRERERIMCILISHIYIYIEREREICIYLSEVHVPAACALRDRAASSRQAQQLRARCGPEDKTSLNAYKGILRQLLFGVTAKGGASQRCR